MGKPFSSFWLAAWSLGLSFGWLLNNHYAPWISFHSDAWIAYWLALATGVVFLRSKKYVEFHRLAAVCALVVAVPFFQYWFDLEEIKEINQSNESFRSFSIEEELLLEYFEVCKKDDEDAIFFTTTSLLSYLSERARIHLNESTKNKMERGAKTAAGIAVTALAVFGGIGSIPGAMIGGLSIGILETLVSGYGNSMYRDAVVFAFLILILIIKPSGLLGKNTREKV